MAKRDEKEEDEEFKGLDKFQRIWFSCYAVAFLVFISAASFKVRGVFTGELSILKITIFEWGFLGTITFFVHLGIFVSLGFKFESLRRMKFGYAIMRTALLLLFFFFL